MSDPTEGPPVLELDGVVVRYGKGRVFGTPMGHVDRGAKVGEKVWPAMKCVGFSTLIQRGAEWAATGDVTQEVPESFPSSSEVKLR